MRKTALFLILAAFTVTAFQATSARAAAPSQGTTTMSHEDDNMRAFTTSCIYGVLAGTLVGAATLAFTSKPGDNLNNVARGASYGLYAGILLGAYVAYVVPNQEEGMDGEMGPGGEELPPEGEPLPDEGSLKKHKSDVASVRFFRTVEPILPTQEQPGWGVHSQLLEIRF